MERNRLTIKLKLRIGKDLKKKKIQQLLSIIFELKKCPAYIKKNNLNCEKQSIPLMILNVK